jgi:catechol 2,3-dioxygenase-like lactoylglutathione lyase family enzyme
MKWNLHHVTIQTQDVAKSLHFYREVLGLESDGRHTIGTGGTDLGLNDKTLAVIGQGNRGLHLFGLIPDFAQRTGLPINPSVGGHIAITVADISEVKRRLEAAGIFYSSPGEYAMPGVYQLYVYDPAGKLIEINQDSSNKF